jgi:ADP-ribose pyrophosphatase
VGAARELRGRAPVSDRRILPWSAADDEREIATTRIFRLTRRTFTSASRPGVSLDAALLRCPPWVNVVALTEDRRVVLIEQFRHGIGRVTLEIPGGMVDEGETPAEAAARELLEETGYAGDAPVLLGTTSPNPAFQDNELTTWLIDRCRLVGEAAGDGHEEIAVSTVPVEELAGLVRSGRIEHSLVVAAFGLFMLRQAEEPAAIRTAG